MKEFKGYVKKYFFTIWKMNLDMAKIYNDNDAIQFLIGQKERGGKSHRLHYQGAVHLKKKCSIRQLRRIFSLGKGEDSGWFEVQRGNNEQVRAYVHKMDTCENDSKFKFGAPSIQGKRTDLEDIKERIRKGESDFNIMQDHFTNYCRYKNGIQYWRELCLKEKSRKFRHVKIEILSGPSGIGKSRKYMYSEESPDIKLEGVYKIDCSKGLKWWNGYEGEKTLILEEFKNQVEFCELLTILDGHQKRLDVKNGFTYALWDKVIICTNLKKEQIYPNVKGNLKKPLWRRLEQNGGKFIDLYKLAEVSKGNIGTLDNFENDDEIYPDPDEFDISDYEEYKSDISDSSKGIAYKSATQSPQSGRSFVK